MIDRPHSLTGPPPLLWVRDYMDSIECFLEIADHNGLTFRDYPASLFVYHDASCPHFAGGACGCAAGVTADMVPVPVPVTVRAP